MPTYTMDYGSGANDAWGRGLSALAQAFTPDYKGEADAKLRAAQADSAYSSGASSLASARKYNSEAAGIEATNAFVSQLAEVLASPTASIEEKQRAIVTLGPLAEKYTGANVGAGSLAMQPFAEGAEDPASFTPFQLGSGMDFGDTVGGVREARRNENQKWAEEQAAKQAELDRTFNRELIEVVDPQTRLPGFVERQKVTEGTVPLTSETDAKGVGILFPGEGQGPQVPGYEGTGMDAQDNNTIMRYNTMQGQPTPAQEIQYAMAYNRMYGPKIEIRPGPDGNPYQVTTQPPVPPGLRPPSQAARVIAESEQAAPAQAPQIPQAGFPASPALSFGNVGQQPPAQPVAPQAPVMGPPQAPGQSNVSAVPVPGMGSAPPKAPTEAQSKYRQYATRIDAGTQRLMSVLGYDPVSGQFAPDAWRPSMWEEAKSSILGQEGFGGAVNNYLKDPERRMYDTSVAQALNPLIRADSGAAVPEGEYPRYYAQYVPQAGDDDATAKAKLDHLMLTKFAFDEASRDPGFMAEMARAEATGDYTAVQQTLHSIRERVATAEGMQTLVMGKDRSGNPVIQGFRNPDGTVVPAQQGAALGGAAPKPPKEGLQPDGSVILPGGLVARPYKPAGAN